jgi:uncharacterized protein YeeX (DUF496 family)
MNTYKDNRDIRDNNYKGELILPYSGDFAVTKEEAYKTIETILIKDKEHYENKIEEWTRQIEHAKNQVTAIEERLIEIPKT